MHIGMQKIMAESIAKSLPSIHEKMAVAVASRKTVAKAPLLVAVSKTKPVDLILEAYDAGQRHFGENYVKELVQKSRDPRILSSCPEIRWHFIGHLQGNKCKKIVDLPNIWMVETIDTLKLAESLNSSMARITPSRTLNVMLEVNTSGETNKHGFQPNSMEEAAAFIGEKCQALKLVGLMTIGAVEHSVDIRPNPDFVILKDLQEKVCKKLNIPLDQLDLSMGMSADYEHAIEMGSSEVRVGSLIFGSRNVEPFIPAESSGDEKEK